MELEEFFKNAFKKIDIDLPFKRVESNISNYQKYSLSVNLSPSVMESEEMYFDKVKENIVNEINQYILKVIIGDIKSNGSVDFIDVSNIIDNTNYSAMTTKSRKIVSEIKMLNLPNVITNGRISSDYIMDSAAFNLAPIKIQKLNAFTKQGNLFGSVDVYIDPYMKWNDDFILSYDDVYYDVSDIKINIRQEATDFHFHKAFSPVLKVEFMIYHNIINPKLTYIIENLTSNTYSKYKAELRNKRIDNLLDDDKTLESNL
jgi:hypothetical protein